MHSAGPANNLFRFASPAEATRSIEVSRVRGFEGFFEGPKQQRAFQEYKEPGEKECFLVAKLPKKLAKRWKISLWQGDGKHDAYMFGLGGAKSENVQKLFVF